MSSEELLTRFIKARANKKGITFTRSLYVKKLSDVGQIRVTKKMVYLCPSFINSSTDLVRLADRILSLTKDFDERKDKERNRRMLELERNLTTDFSRLAGISPARAEDLLHEMRKALEQM